MAPVPVTAPPEPVLVIPETVPATSPPAEPQPTIVIPTELSEAPAGESAITTEEPAAEPAPGAATATRAEQPAPAAAAAPPAPAPASADVTAPADPASLAAEEVTTAEPLLAAEPLAPLPASEPLETPAASTDANNTQLWIAVLAGLAAIALAIWGFVAIGRRTPVDRKAAAVVERPVVTPRRPVPEAAIDAPAVTPLATARPQTAAPSLAHTGAAVPLPRSMPETFAERDALLKRMIAAKPDRANPFTTYKARLKRARLILQSLGRDFGNQEPWIDFSQYPSNWPEAASRKHAAA